MLSFKSSSWLLKTLLFRKIIMSCPQVFLQNPQKFYLCSLFSIQQSRFKEPSRNLFPYNPAIINGNDFSPVHQTLVKWFTNTLSPRCFHDRHKPVCSNPGFLKPLPNFPRDWIQDNPAVLCLYTHVSAFFICPAVPFCHLLGVMYQFPLCSLRKLPFR